ncbi:hypothetical protein CRUP_028355 [Coryphaenoides rupestris]|nr:hypothetical protein CRUP_028355 [Coryphaenoides rupestris]
MPHQATQTWSTLMQDFSTRLPDLVPACPTRLPRPGPCMPHQATQTWSLHAPPGYQTQRVEDQDREGGQTNGSCWGNQTNLADSHCIRCLQPFKFLVNSKRQCLDCQLYTCKSCSRYNKKEHGWGVRQLQDDQGSERSARWAGTTTTVRNRFKRFGSAKVMRSLYKRLNGDGEVEATDIFS